MKQTQKKERKRDKKTNTHWSYILLALILNFFGIVSFNLHSHSELSVQFSSVQLLSCVCLFMTPWTVVC